MARSCPRSSVPSQRLPTVVCMDVIRQTTGQPRTLLLGTRSARNVVFANSVRRDGGGVVGRLRSHWPPTARGRSRLAPRSVPDPWARASRLFDRRHLPLFRRLVLLSPIQNTSGDFAVLWLKNISPTPPAPASSRATSPGWMRAWASTASALLIVEVREVDLDRRRRPGCGQTQTIERFGQLPGGKDRHARARQSVERSDACQRAGDPPRRLPAPGRSSRASCHRSRHSPRSSKRRPDGHHRGPTRVPPARGRAAAARARCTGCAAVRNRRPPKHASWVRSIPARGATARDRKSNPTAHRSWPSHGQPQRSPHERAPSSSMDARVPPARACGVSSCRPRQVAARLAGAYEVLLHLPLKKKV